MIYTFLLSLVLLICSFVHVQHSYQCKTIRVLIYLLCFLVRQPSVVQGLLFYGF
jgi:hypothetical protein